ncbi:hypothetical protein [Planktotalea sp.]|uniref:hypothetical protein n=1 Tax=Planktotalea sp. TaxID=2029877 RepID=UPI00329685B0
MAEDQSIEAIEQKALAALRAKLGIRARSLPKAMKRAGRRLPKDAHRAGDQMIAALAQTTHPKLSRMVDMGAVARASTILHMHLDKIDPKERRKDWWLSLAGSLAFNLLGVIALVIVLLAWRGLL